MRTNPNIAELTISVQIEPLLLRRDDAARVLSVSPRLFDDLVLAGLISKVKVGGVVAYDPEDLRAFVRQIKRNGYSTAEIRALIERAKAHRNGYRQPRSNSSPIEPAN